MEETDSNLGLGFPAGMMGTSSTVSSLHMKKLIYSTLNFFEQENCHLPYMLKWECSVDRSVNSQIAGKVRRNASAWDESG